MTPAISDHPNMNHLTAKMQSVLLFSLENFSAIFRQLLHASPKAPTFGALLPARPRPVSRPVPGLTCSLQSCVSAVKTVFMDGHKSAKE
jgi:hypothetical protein